MKRALVLAGGGSRGSYHAGVWTALREIGWHPNIVTGTSVGALFGAAVVCDRFEEARAILTSVTDRDIAVLPEKFTDFTKLGSFITDITLHAGLDVSPLEKLLCEALDEDLVRSSPIDFGIVVVQKDGMRPIELTISEIPHGKLHDYLLASAAFYPLYRARKIKSKPHIDGGYYDNLPIGLAEDMGADEIIAVDLKSIGIVQKYTGMLPVRYIRSYWDLGSIQRFIPARAERNCRLGYLDTMKSFRRLEGKAFAFEPGGLDHFLSKYPDIIRRSFSHIESVDSAVIGALLLLRKHADIHRNRKNAMLAFSEITGKSLGLSPERLYSFSEFLEEILSVYKDASTIELDPRHLTLSRKNTVRSMAETMAIGHITPLLTVAASALPQEFIAACFIAALLSLDTETCNS